MPRIVHFSDWHGQWSELPEADVYLCTGDMLDNYPKVARGATSFDPFMSNRVIDPAREVELQTGWLNTMISRGGLRRFLASPQAPVVVVRGNHDFVELGPYFGEPVFDITLDASRTAVFEGLRFGGFRGIPFIKGEWTDELQQPDFEPIVAALPDDLDVLCTHAPPDGILDAGYQTHCGIRMLTRWIQQHQYNDQPLPRLFCFGHMHGGLGGNTFEDGTMFSNAATSKRVIVLDQR